MGSAGTGAASATDGDEGNAGSAQPSGAGEEEFQGSADPFFELLSFTRVTPIPRSPAQIVTDSQQIVIGTLAAVEDGRVIDFATGASNPLFTAVFEISIDEVIKGEQGATAYAEFVRAGISIERIRELLPEGEPMAFVLDEPFGWDTETYEFQNEGAGLPAGARLLAFSAPAGIVVETQAGLEYPLSDQPTTPVFEARTLADLGEELRSLSAVAP
jgi:hypothetical protein